MKLRHRGIELLTDSDPHFCGKKPVGETIFTPEYV